MGSFLEYLKHHIVPSQHNAYHPHLLRGSWFGFFIALTLVIEGFLVTNLMVRQSSQNFLAAVVPGEIIALTNTQRNQNSILILRENSALNAAAQAKANDMAFKGYFSYANPGNVTPWTWIDNAGYSYQTAGENIAVRFLDSKEVLNAWMNSPSHRANIVKGSYADVGAGVAQGMYHGKPATYVVEYFAAPDPSQNQVAVAAHSSSWLRPLASLEAEPLTTTQWVLGSIAALLLVLLIISIVTHIQIQHFKSIVSGLAVLSLTLLLLESNSMFLSGNNQTATVVEGLQTPGDGYGVVIPSSAAYTER